MSDTAPHPQKAAPISAVKWPLWWRRYTRAMTEDEKDRAVGSLVRRWIANQHELGMLEGQLADAAHGLQSAATVLGGNAKHNFQSDRLRRDADAAVRSHDQWVAAKAQQASLAVRLRSAGVHGIELPPEDETT